MIALRLGSELGSPHTCCCGRLVDATGTRGLLCKLAPSRAVRHHALNDCISRCTTVPSAQPAFPCGRNQQVCFRKTGSALTTAFLSLGVVADSGLGCHSVHHSGCFVRDRRQSISRSR